MAIASTLETGSFVILSDAGRETPATMIREIDALGFAGKVVHARVALAEPASSSEESARVGDLLEQARSENGPLVLVFSGIFCLVCARLDKETLANSRVMAALKQVIFHRIKVEEDRAAARCPLTSALRARGVGRMKRLENKTAVVTGGTTGIGFATAQKFIAEGARVAILARKQEELDKAAAELGRDCVAMRGDVTNARDLADFYTEVERKWGKVDVVFANAGIGEFTDVDASDGEHFDRLFDVNAKGVFLTVQKALPHLGEHASIVINASISGRKGFEKLVAYSASKAAARSLARTLSADLIPRGIRVNSVSPGLIDTPIHPKMGAAGEDVRENARQAIPLGRAGRPEDIANAVAFLASDEAAYITGIELIVDGGLTQL